MSHIVEVNGDNVRKREGWDFWLLPKQVSNYCYDIKFLEIFLLTLYQYIKRDLPDDNGEKGLTTEQTITESSNVQHEYEVVTEESNLLQDEDENKENREMPTIPEDNSEVF